MSRREFLKTSMLVGTLVLTKPTFAFGARRAIVRVTLDDALGYDSRVVAQRYLGYLADALGESASILDDAQAQFGKNGDAHGADLEIVISSFWNLGSGLSALIADRNPTPGGSTIGVISEAPLSVCVSRFMPRTWEALVRSKDYGQIQLRCGLPAGDAVVEKLAPPLFAQAGLAAGTWVRFRGGYQILPALVGAKLGVGIAPLNLFTLAGRPGGYGDVLKSHRRGDLAILATAVSERLTSQAEIPTLNEIFGQSGHEALLTTVIRYNDPGDALLAKQVRAATNRIVARLNQ